MAPTPESVAADVAARIREADQKAQDASAAFAAGRFEEWWEKEAAEVQNRLETDSAKLFADTGNGQAGG